MNAKAYLEQARYLDMRIKSKCRQIETLNELADSCTAVLTNMPKSPGPSPSRVETSVLKILTLQEEIRVDIDRLVELKREIMSIIKEVSDTELQTLLEKRYLCYLSWEQIAVEMSFSIQHIYRMHDAALNAIDRILERKTPSL